MDDDFLIRLRKYSPSPERDPREDFVTEVFGWLLTQFPEVSDRFLTLIEDRLPDAKKLDILGEKIRWSTQYTLGPKRADMAAEWKDGLLLFEHKVGAELTDSQITQYRDEASSRYPDKTVRVIGVTATRAENSRKADAQVCWEDIAEYLVNFQSDTKHQLRASRVTEFIRLLKFEGIVPTEPISAPAATFYPTARHFPEQLEQALNGIKHMEWSLPRDFKQPELRKAWGRIGLQFHRESAQVDWAPGIFAGCVLDGSDHGIDDRLESEVLFQIIIEFSECLHSKYPAMESFEAVRDDLAREFTDGDWRFYDHFSENRNRNAYHPLYLERPLVPVISEKASISEQRDVLHESIEEVLRFLRTSKAFSQLIRDCDSAMA